ncbi:MADF domain-containing protein, partial [Meloidogyne graminicola]
MWDSEKLKKKLCDYAYFHSIKIFNPNAEYQFANSKSKHPYFLAYENIRQQVKIIIKNLVSIFNFPTDMQIAARRVFMSEIKNKKDSTCCVICCKQSIKSSYVLNFEGYRYKNNFELIKSDYFLKPNNFIVCYNHSKIFTVYYRLLHMDWNIHWNCYLRLSQIQKRLPNLNTCNVINAIDPQIFLNISNEYFCLFKMLDDLVYSSNRNRSKFPTTFAESLFNWEKTKGFIKDIGILKRIE